MTQPPAAQSLAVRSMMEKRRPKTRKGKSAPAIGQWLLLLVPGAVGFWLLTPRRFPRFPISTREAARETSQLLLPQELATRQLAKTGLPKTQKGKRRLVLHALLASCPQRPGP